MHLFFSWVCIGLVVYNYFDLVLFCGKIFKCWDCCFCMSSSLKENIGWFIAGFGLTAIIAAIIALTIT